MTRSGRGRCQAEGSDVTVVAWSKTLIAAPRAARQLDEEGISVEIIAPRTLQPLDVDTICESVAKTGHLVATHQAVKFGGFGAGIAAQIAERAWDSLRKPPLRIGAPFVAVPYSEPMESFVVPQPDHIAQEIKQYLG